MALIRSGIKIENYFSSEIDKHAITVTQKNYPETIQLGNVMGWRDWDLPKIDLLIGGPPCQGFSTMGHGLNFDDPRSKLFFEYVDVLRHFKPKYFLLENVRMKKEYQDIITEYLGVEPVKINSSLVSAQNRERLYWTNIVDIKQPVDQNIYLKDILIDDPDKQYYINNRKGSIKYVINKYEEFYEKHGYTPKMFNPYNCKQIVNKSPTLTAEGRRISVSSTVLIQDEKGDIRSLTPIEWERLQTIPENYTATISDTHRYNVLGNAWTVDVIAHILKNIK